MLIFSAPSGSGKSTIINLLLEKHNNLEFSISATTRKPRGEEVDGKDYHFLTNEEFQKHINANEFVEWEEVYPGRYYGTLKSEVERVWNKGNIVIFDIDVVGALNIKEAYGEKALSLFITAPSIEEIRSRLTGRNTDSNEDINKRIEKATYELSFRDKFDKEVINDNLEEALLLTERIINEFSSK